jgi:hypothetical protein
VLESHVSFARDATKVGGASAPLEVLNAVVVAAPNFTTIEEVQLAIRGWMERRWGASCRHMLRLIASKWNDEEPIKLPPGKSFPEYYEDLYAAYQKEIRALKDLSTTPDSGSATALAASASKPKRSGASRPGAVWFLLSVQAVAASGDEHSAALAEGQGFRKRILSKRRAGTEAGA